jgi:hypothetical protein
MSRHEDDRPSQPWLTLGLQIAILSAIAALLVLILPYPAHTSIVAGISLCIVAGILAILPHGWRLLVFGSLVFSIVVLLYSLASEPDPHWPAINDPAKLRHAATILCAQPKPATNDGPDGWIRKYRDDWPPEVAALSPRFVDVAPDVIKIHVSSPHSKRHWGYLVYADTVKRSDGGISKYEGPPASAGSAEFRIFLTIGAGLAMLFSGITLARLTGALWRDPVPGYPVPELAYLTLSYAGLLALMIGGTPSQGPDWTTVGVLYFTLVGPIVAGKIAKALHRERNFSSYHRLTFYAAAAYLPVWLITMGLAFLGLEVMRA